MVKLPLTGPWQFRQAGTETWLSATVPGAVHTDLMAAGRIPDPFFGENELQVKWVADQDWEYRREFDTNAGLLAEERIYLVCDGLDTPGRGLTQWAVPRPDKQHVSPLPLGGEKAAPGR